MTKEHPVENDTKAKTKRLLDKHGWFHFSVPGTRFGSNGTSDRIAVKFGIMLAIENKAGFAPEPKGTPLQEKFLANVRAHGGYGIVVSEGNLDALERLLVRIEAVQRHAPL